MKNIRQRKRSRQDTPKKKSTRELPRILATRTAQPAFLIKDILSLDKKEQIGTRRIVPGRYRRQKSESQMSEKKHWALPPIPILRSCDRDLADPDVFIDISEVGL